MEEKTFTSIPCKGRKQKSKFLLTIGSSNCGHIIFLLSMILLGELLRDELNKSGREETTMTPGVATYHVAKEKKSQREIQTQTFIFLKSAVSKKRIPMYGCMDGCGVKTDRSSDIAMVTLSYADNKFRTKI